jgi:hypothetical protein
VIVYALGETWFAVFGGLIPIIGLAAIALILYRAIGPNDASEDESVSSEEASNSEEATSSEEASSSEEDRER